MRTKFAWIGLGVGIGLALVFTGWWWSQRNYRYQGSLIDPPAAAADFTLTDQNNTPFSLSEQRGKIVLIFFGYTHCPDVCPVTLSQYRQIKERLKERAEDVRFLFVTVDPERDTVTEMKRYVPAFDPAFIGLTGTAEEIQAVTKSYGVYSEKAAPDEQGNYLVDHTARIYLVDQQGNWRLTYPFGMETGQIVQDLNHLLR